MPERDSRRETLLYSLVIALANCENRNVIVGDLTLWFSEDLNLVAQDQASVAPTAAPNSFQLGTNLTQMITEPLQGFFVDLFAFAKQRANPVVHAYDCSSPSTYRLASVSIEFKKKLFVAKHRQIAEAPRVQTSATVRSESNCGHCRRDFNSASGWLRSRSFDETSKADKLCQVCDRLYRSSRLHLEHQGPATAQLALHFRRPCTLIRACCECKRFHHPVEDQWLSVPDFLTDMPENVTFGLCEPCYHTTWAARWETPIE